MALDSSIIVGFLITSLSISLTRAYTKKTPHLPDPAIDLPASAGSQTAVFAGGCFWCTEAVFEQLHGVTKVISGYAGGSAESAHYSLVSGGGTNHAESIEITYDPSKISYGRLLQAFFSVAHDPTQLNRQGPDRGYQYRSVIYYTSEEQRRTAEAYVQQLRQAKSFSEPIVTKIEQLPVFYPGEENHQDYVKKNPYDPYVIVNAAPKLKKLKETFPGWITSNQAVR
ncbi:MAG: peptide-methionine (S)-S-oxide reductase MsrA [Bryobacteraceae bacterium]